MNESRGCKKHFSHERYLWRALLNASAENIETRITIKFKYSENRRLSFNLSGLFTRAVHLFNLKPFPSVILSVITFSFYLCQDYDRNRHNGSQN